MEDFYLKRWPIKCIKNGNLFSMLIIGSRKSGKSYMVKHLFKLARFSKYYDFIVVFCNSGDIKDFYSNFIPGDLFFKEYNEEYMVRIFQQSEKFKQEGNPKKYLIIFDDSVGSDEKNSNSILQSYATGRHHNVSIIFCSQRLYLTNTTARNNSDVILIGNSRSAIEKKYITDTFLRGSLELAEIPQGVKECALHYHLIRKYTVNYNFLILDYSNETDNSFKCTVFFYRAPGPL